MASSSFQPRTSIFESFMLRLLLLLLQQSCGVTTKSEMPRKIKLSFFFRIEKKRERGEGGRRRKSSIVEKCLRRWRLAAVCENRSRRGRPFEEMEGADLPPPFSILLKWGKNPLPLFAAEIHAMLSPTFLQYIPNQ